MLLLLLVQIETRRHHLVQETNRSFDLIDLIPDHTLLFFLLHKVLLIDAINDRLDKGCKDEEANCQSNGQIKHQIFFIHHTYMLEELLMIGKQIVPFFCRYAGLDKLSVISRQLREDVLDGLHTLLETLQLLEGDWELFHPGDT